MKNFIISILFITTLSTACVKLPESIEVARDKKQYGIEQLNNLHKEDLKNATIQEEKIHPIDKKFDNCIANHYSTEALSICAYDALNSWFKEIDKYLILLKEVVSKEDFQKIELGQKEWKIFQKIEFETYEIILNKQGTMFQNVAVGNKMNLVKERALNLKSLYDTMHFAN